MLKRAVGEPWRASVRGPGSPAPLATSGVCRRVYSKDGRNADPPEPESAADPGHPFDSPTV